MSANDLANWRIFMDARNQRILTRELSAAPGQPFCIVDGMNFLYNYEVMSFLHSSFPSALPWAEEDAHLLSAKSRPEYLERIKKFETGPRIALLTRLFLWLAALCPSNNFVLIYRGKYDAILTNAQKTLFVISTKEYIGGRTVNKLEADDLIAVTLYVMLERAQRRPHLFSLDRFLWIKDEPFRAGLVRGRFEDLFLASALLE